MNEYEQLNDFPIMYDTVEYEAIIKCGEHVLKTIVIDMEGLGYDEVETKALINLQNEGININYLFIENIKVTELSF